MTRFLFLIVPLCLVCLAPTLAYAGDAGTSPMAVTLPPEHPAAPAPAVATAELPPEVTADLDTLSRLVRAVRSGIWRDAAGLALILIMGLFGLIRDRFKYFKGDRGGVISVFSLSLAGALSASLLSSAPIDFKMFYTAGLIAITAIGGFTAVKRLIWPEDA